MLDKTLSAHFSCVFARYSLRVHTALAIIRAITAGITWKKIWFHLLHALFCCYIIIFIKLLRYKEQKTMLWFQDISIIMFLKWYFCYSFKHVPTISWVLWENMTINWFKLYVLLLKTPLYIYSISSRLGFKTIIPLKLHNTVLVLNWSPLPCTIDRSSWLSSMCT